MDHSIDNLNICLFSYLASIPDSPKSFIQIFNDITGETGHRCSELNDPVLRNANKNKFMISCYSLDNEYDNIHKIYKNDVVYLVYSDNLKVEVMVQFDQYHNDISLDTSLGIGDMNNIVDSLVGHKIDLTTPIDNSILEYLVRNGEHAKFKKLCDIYEIDFDFDKLIKLALEHKSIDILKELYECQLKEQKHGYDVHVSHAKKSNTKLLNDNKILSMQNTTLRDEMSSFGFYRQMTTIFGLMSLLLMVVCYFK
jgi:regulator of replication initiation timing